MAAAHGSAPEDCAGRGGGGRQASLTRGQSARRGKAGLIAADEATNSVVGAVDAQAPKVSSRVKYSPHTVAALVRPPAPVGGSHGKTTRPQHLPIIFAAKAPPHHRRVGPRGCRPAPRHARQSIGSGHRNRRRPRHCRELLGAGRPMRVEHRAEQAWG
ncbi:hypothetical protein ACFPRL_20655 [Pseudoclavibacter helvolus]